MRQRGVFANVARNYNEMVTVTNTIVNILSRTSDVFLYSVHFCALFATTSRHRDITKIQERIPTH